MDRNYRDYREDVLPPVIPCRCGAECLFAGNPDQFGPCWGDVAEDRSGIRGPHRICSAEHACDGHRLTLSENVYTHPPRKIHTWI